MPPHLEALGWMGMTVIGALTGLVIGLADQGSRNLIDPATATPR